MSVLVKDMTMPKDCPMCPMAHWNVFNMFSGCEAVPDKKYAIRDPEYANSDHRPAWCPLVDVPPHGDLVERQTALDACFDGWNNSASDCATNIRSIPTIIPAEEGET